MSLALSKGEILRDRALMLARSRAFFSDRGLLEVDVPILSRTASIDLHIDLVQVRCCGKVGYLHSSPEYGMKRLLAEGMGDIYQISHVFRDHEWGSRHTTEFMMAEWYRMGFAFQHMLEETIDYIALFIDPKRVERWTYHEVFTRFVGRYPHSPEERDHLYAFEIEPLFTKQALTVVTDFPPEQAALARLGENGMAERFEMYYGGMELANGYHELTDPEEQRSRLVTANQARVALGKEALPIDEEFLSALEQGIPDCCGVAVGFDRLMMLRHQLEEIRDASSFFV